MDSQHVYWEVKQTLSEDPELKQEFDQLLSLRNFYFLQKFK